MYPLAVSTLSDIADGISTGKFLVQPRTGSPLLYDLEDAVRRVRASTTKAETRAIKASSLPAFTCYGAYMNSVSKLRRLVTTDLPEEDIASLTQVDLDGIANLDACIAIISVVRKLESVALAFISPSGLGVKILVQCDFIPDADAYEYGAFPAACGYIRDALPDFDIETVTDGQVKARNNLCFLPYDPDVHYNPDAVPLPYTVNKPPDYVPAPYVGEQDLDADERTAREALAYIDASCTRDEWLVIASSLKHLPNGLPLFVEWSSTGENYDGQAECVRTWESVATYGNIGAIVNRAKENGFDNGRDEYRPLRKWGEGVQVELSDSESTAGGDRVSDKPTSESQADLSSLYQELPPHQMVAFHRSEREDVELHRIAHYLKSSLSLLSNDLVVSNASGLWVRYNDLLHGRRTPVVADLLHRSYVALSQDTESVLKTFDRYPSEQKVEFVSEYLKNLEALSSTKPYRLQQALAGRLPEYVATPDVYNLLERRIGEDVWNVNEPVVPLNSGGGVHLRTGEYLKVEEMRPLYIRQSEQLGVGCDSSDAPCKDAPCTHSDDPAQALMCRLIRTHWPSQVLDMIGYALLYRAERGVFIILNPVSGAGKGTLFEVVRLATGLVSRTLSAGLLYRKTQYNELEITLCESIIAHMDEVDAGKNLTESEKPRQVPSNQLSSITQPGYDKLNPKGASQIDMYRRGTLFMTGAAPPYIDWTDQGAEERLLGAWYGEWGGTLTPDDYLALTNSPSALRMMFYHLSQTVCPNLYRMGKAEAEKRVRGSDEHRRRVMNPLAAMFVSEVATVEELFEYSKGAHLSAKEVVDDITNYALGELDAATRNKLICVTLPGVRYGTQRVQGKPTKCFVNLKRRVPGAARENRSTSLVPDGQPTLKQMLKMKG